MIKNTKKEMEKIIFESFKSIEPDFAGEEVECEQCPKDPPDFICKNGENRRIGIELVEWLHEDQTMRSRAFEDTEQKIKKELSYSIKDFLRICDVIIHPIQGKSPSKSYRPRFVSELIEILNDFISSISMSEKIYSLNDFNGYPMLQQYISRISILKTRVPSGIEFVKGGAYSPKDALNALFERLDAKINSRNYKNLKKKMGLNELYLVIYYSMALIYNSPFIGVEQDLNSIVNNCRIKLLEDHGPFDKIFLFYSLEPNLKVFHLWP
jgi:hypothetical protein